VDAGRSHKAWVRDRGLDDELVVPCSMIIVYLCQFPLSTSPMGKMGLNLGGCFYIHWGALYQTEGTWIVDSVRKPAFPFVQSETLSSKTVK
jgi:hypothetical protein